MDKTNQKQMDVRIKIYGDIKKGIHFRGCLLPELKN